MTELESLRQHLNATRPEGAPKLTYLPFIMQALVKALAQRPECNALYDDEQAWSPAMKPSTSALPPKPTGPLRPGGQARGSHGHLAVRC